MEVGHRFSVPWTSSFLDDVLALQSGRGGRGVTKLSTDFSGGTGYRKALLPSLVAKSALKLNVPVKLSSHIFQHGGGVSELQDPKSHSRVFRAKNADVDSSELKPK